MLLGNVMNWRHNYKFRPTVFGGVLGLVVITVAIVRPSVADPSVTGLVWAGIAGAWLVGLIWPVVSLQRIVVTATDNPANLQMGDVGKVHINVEGYGLGVAIHMTGMETVYSDVALPATLDLPIVVARRGKFQRVQLEVSTDAPFGILWVTRKVVVKLPNPLVVGPRPTPHQVAPQAIMRGEEELATSDQSPLSDTIRSVRPYVNGDPFHFVDWKSTARRGEIIIKEFDPPAQQAICLVLQLQPARVFESSSQQSDEPSTIGGSQPFDTNDVDASHRMQQEQLVSQIFGATDHALSLGMRVVLCTWEQSGGVAQQRCEEIEHPLMAQRQLATAVAGPGGQAPMDNIPTGWSLQVVGASNE